VLIKQSVVDGSQFVSLEKFFSWLLVPDHWIMATQAAAHFLQASAQA
jgi:hypothetical protein